MTDHTTVERKSLEDLLDGARPDAAEANATAEPTQQPTGDQSAPAQAAEQPPAAAAKPGETGEPPAPEDDEADDRQVPFKALKSERRKRQELERKFAELERRVSQPAAQQGEDEMPDPIVDPKGYAKYIDDQQFKSVAEASHLDLVDELGEEDVGQKVEAFKQAAAADPTLAQRLRKSRDPARFAYNQGKKFIEAQQTTGDPDEAAYAKFKSRFEAEYDLVPKQKQPANAGAQPTQQAQTGKPSTQPKTNVRLPTSLAGVTSAGPRNPGAKPIARRSLDEILPN